MWDPPPRFSLDADPSLYRFIGAMRLKPQTTARITFTPGLMSSRLHVAGVTGTVPSPDTSSPSRSPLGVWVHVGQPLPGENEEEDPG